MTTALRKAQLEMAGFLRDPAGSHPPEGIEARRLQVYRDLVYRNIEGFISSAFPVLRSLYSDDDWEGLVREFIQTHRCETPLFLRISEEFLAFLSALDPQRLRPFEAELAHYEWLELAVDVAEAALNSRNCTRLSRSRYTIRNVGVSAASGWKEDPIRCTGNW